MSLGKWAKIPWDYPKGDLTFIQSTLDQLVWKSVKIIKETFYTFAWAKCWDQHLRPPPGRGTLAIGRTGGWRHGSSQGKAAPLRPEAVHGKGKMNSGEQEELESWVAPEPALLCALGQNDFKAPSRTPRFSVCLPPFATGDSEWLGLRWKWSSCLSQIPPHPPVTKMDFTVNVPHSYLTN